MPESLNIALYTCKKVTIEREYRFGKQLTMFEKMMPFEFEGCISHANFASTMDGINELLEKMEVPTTKSLYITLLSLATCTIANMLHKRHAQQIMEDMSDFIENQNEAVFHPAGYHLSNPFDSGLRFIEIYILSTGKYYDEGN
uniref:Erf4 domain-containing protein n=1 Tax=Rhabditophanes sp. KR3021 TaxID=114890 RepID=A0AC35U503_9BILA